MKRIFNFCTPYLKHYLGFLILYVFICISLSSLSILSPYITGDFIDNLIKANDIKFVYHYFIIFVSISILTLIIGYFSSRMYVKIQTKLSYSLNKDIIKHLHKVPLSFLQKFDSVYLNQRVNMDSNALITFCIDILQNIIINCFMIIVPLILLFSFNIKLAFFLIIISILYFFLYVVYRKQLYKISFSFKEEQARFFNRLNEQLANIKFVKVHSLFVDFIQRLDNSFIGLLNQSLRFQHTNYIFTGLDKVIFMIAQMIMLFIGGIEIINGRLSIGQFTVMSNYFSMLMGSMHYFFNLGQIIQENLVSYNRLCDITKVSVENNGKIILNNIDEIEINNINFSYGDKTVIKNMSVKFTRGKIYAIIGHNGSGKSTLLDILIGLHMGEYDGEIKYNNILMQDIDMYDLRTNHISVSEQEPMLISASLNYNIFFDNMDYNLDINKINKLTDILGLSCYIDLLPEKLDTIVNEKAMNLSGGEKQKISILRALLKETDVVILDEPTSALDIDSSKRLRNYLEEIKQDKIIIFVSHDKEFISANNDIIINMTL